MGAIGLNPIRFDRIGLDPIRINAIKLGVPGASSTDRPYIDPEVLASLKAVCICYGKSNDDPDRAIVKNLVDPDNPFVISNAAFKLNSGFGEYAADFLNWTSSKDVQKTSFEVKITSSNYKENWVAYKAPNTTFKAMKVRISGIPDGGYLQFFRATADGGGIKMVNGINEIPAFTNTVAAGFYIDIPLGFDWSNLVIEQIPSFEGAFVTDGIDDLITSTKTVEEMLGGSNEITVVSMIHQIDGNVNYTNGYTNYIRHGGGFIRSVVTGANGKGFNKTGIYGYTSTNLNSSSMNLGNIVNNILGDKDDYSFERSSTYTLDDAKYSVQNFVNANNQPSNEGSSVAWYWTFIANKVLTTDQINQVIAYFNLDRTLKSDIYCNIAKQGITNYNHAEFGDKLIDFSGNGRDIQMYNLAWNGDSGIGDYEVDFTTWNTYGGLTVSKNSFSIKSELSSNTIIQSKNNYKAPSFKIKIKGLPKGGVIQYRRADKSGSGYYQNFDSDGDYECMAGYDGGYSSFMVSGDKSLYVGVTVEQISSKIGALCLDGVNDFGKVTGMPIYKDYTFIAEREILSVPDLASTGSLVSKAYEFNKGAFIVEDVVQDYAKETSFSNTTDFTDYNTNRSIIYQSKYSYNGKALTAGQVEDRDVMWLGTIRDNDNRFINAAIYSLMSFPYSMSEFLIERQLKKHKLGTLYPDMVEFRPIVKSNSEYQVVDYYIDTLPAVVGNYYPINSKLRIAVVTKSVAEKVTSLTVNGVSLGTPSVNGKRFSFDSTLDSKSPQKISLTIEQDENYVLFNPTITSNAIFEVGNEEDITELTDKVRNHEIDGFIMYLSKKESKYILPNSWINKDAEIIAYIYCLDNTLQDDLYINIDGNSKYCLYASSSNNIAEFIIMDDNIFEEQYITNVLTANTIDIQLDQYIRYEDIVQPYPSLFTLIDYDTEEVYSWGSKLKVGARFKGNVVNLLPNMYEWQGDVLYNGEVLNWGINPGVVAKEMVFSWNMPFKYLIDNNEPKVILSPRLLRIPNSSYKILGYIPDISGHGNNGKINNSAYAEGSGVNEDGSYQFDGVDDFVTIPTLSSGGKQVLMKVNWESGYGKVLYDQRPYTSGLFAIITISEAPAYERGNGGGKTYIDGILNKNILSKELASITHNITLNNNAVTNSNIFIGTDYGNGSYAKMALYDFMLFDEISEEDKIKELNEYVGIEGNTDDLFNETNI